MPWIVCISRRRSPRYNSSNATNSLGIRRWACRSISDRSFVSSDLTISMLIQRKRDEVAFRSTENKQERRKTISRSLERNRQRQENVPMLMELFSVTRRHRRYLVPFGLLISLLSITIYLNFWFDDKRVTRVSGRSLTTHRNLVNDASNTTARFPRVRRNLTARRFTSPAVESLINEIKNNIGNKELAWLFENCFPNALDTTVDFRYPVNVSGEAKPDTYVINGDVEAMSLRDSSAQIHPYLPLMLSDARLRLLVEGVLLRQWICIQRDPFASAFYRSLHQISERKYLDNTEMRDGVHERKWALDSLCYALRLMHSYWREVKNDLTFFRQNEAEFRQTIRILLRTIKEQQRFNGSGKQQAKVEERKSTLFIDWGAYTFQRNGEPGDPRGRQASPNGLIYSYFRPSEDYQTYGYHIPSQFFAHHSLTLLLELLEALKWTSEFQETISWLTSYLHIILFDARMHSNQITMMTHRLTTDTLIFAYEIDGIDNQMIIDDPTIPSLLSLPYLCPNEIPLNHSIYQNTRRFLLSSSQSSAGCGTNTVLSRPVPPRDGTGQQKWKLGGTGQKVCGMRDGTGLCTEMLLSREHFLFFSLRKK